LTRKPECELKAVGMIVCRRNSCQTARPTVPEANGKSTRCVLSSALLPKCFGVAPTLVQHQVRDLALFVPEELDFCVDNSWKKHRLRLSKNRHLGLSRYLRYQLVAF
jgi:hypothetical protein